MVNDSSTSIKVIVIVHFLLTVWASMADHFLPVSYIYMNAFILAFGAWSVLHPDNSDSLLMFLGLHLASIVLDVIFCISFFSSGRDFYEFGSGVGLVNMYRFAMGMAILNLLLKPFTSFILYRIHKDRGGAYGEISLPGMPNFGLGGSSRTGGGYENLDTGLGSGGSMDAGPPSAAAEYNGP